ncbi:ethanolamine ammonia-lyase reactivating factor EutA [Streptomyces odontomachi]|uniref:ethanolamine ammonia-lyase reactivating factor EutA n=1 Tax=Streptomyces odontomachi TaxID=2944940 RepID=UPI00210E84FC|nr:ethanolamine ammonia-lyase reactivating factor EutA [Streptomyces sp. ODS25]
MDNHPHNHGHGDAAAGTPLEENPIWQQDNVMLRSVGMDIGSSGTQVVFSRLHLRRIGEELTSRYLVVRRDTDYRSPVVLTPYASAEHIDATALGAIIDRAYQAAGAAPGDIDTGVVILTGEALRRRNAEVIAGVLAERGGDLVTATAGHHMEAMLAAYGSGAAKASYDQGLRILNIDIGGGTTKLAVLEAGQVVATAAVHIGGRLQVVDEAGRITRLEPAGRAHAVRAGHDWHLGSVARPEEIEKVADGMADALVAALGGAPPPEVAELFLTAPLGELGPIDGVMFSGGVAEYVYGREQASFGDFGRPLGRAVRRRVESGALPYPLLPAGECIRATALGASEYSVQLSGNTGFISDPDALLPRRNLQVVRPLLDLGERVDAVRVTAAVRRRLADLDVLDVADAELVLAVPWSGLPSHARLLPFARGLRDALADRVAHGRPVYVVLDGDVAMTLGRLLRDELGVTGPLLVVDGLRLHDFDYVDIGRVRHPSGTVPVTIKSLVFAEVPPDGPVRENGGEAPEPAQKQR